MDWKQLFRPHILERGLDYYESGFVEDYDEGSDFVQATVQGSSAYDVYVEIIDGKILDMQCDCPYAQEGNHCKHMAALMFCMEHEIEACADSQKGTIKKDDVKIATDSESNIEELVRNADEAAVRYFLTEILGNDDKLLSRFKSILCCEISKEDMKRYKNQINRIFNKYAGRQGFIDYYSADSFISDLIDFLDNDIEGMLKNRQYKEAFELTAYMFVKVGNQDMDDSDGGTGMLANQCMEIWLEIIEHCDMDIKKSMFRWFKEHLDGRVIDYMEEYIEQILFDNFKEDEFLEDKLKFTEEKVCKYRKENDSWTRGYHAGKWILRHITIMNELRISQDRIEKYAKENLEFSAVRKYYIQECMKKGRYDAAIQTLKEGKETDKTAAGLVADYSLQLKELYKRTGRAEDYENELWLLMLQYKAGDVAIYKELKTLYTEEEWPGKREEIFAKLPLYAAVDRLYKEEQLYDRLLKLVLDSNGLYKLMEYEQCLKNLYPEELLTKYETVVNNMAARTSDRKHYRELVAILKRMQKYTGGKKRVDEIVSSWKSQYRNRPAMMDELKRI
ncbi:hypothetical protein [Lacrimispora sp. JR3]|uniref:hypothetical protein n=1 Tax=Lacrimispora sinapis TaxID=3111456 RepID=UPI003749E1CC